MKLYKSTILLGLALAVVVSCNKEASAPVAGDVDPAREIVFTDGGFAAEVVTKAGPTQVTALSGADLKVQCTTGSAGSETSVWAVSSTTKSGSSYQTGKYWPQTNPSYHFYASNAAMTFAAAGTQVKPTSIAQDIVVAYLASPTYKASNALTFEHIYAQVGKCTISAPAGYTVTGLTVKMTPKVPGSSSSYNIRTGAGKTDATGWSGTVDGSEVTLCNAVGSTTDNDLWLVPGSYTLTAAYTLTKGDFTKAYTKTSTVTLQKGKNHNISATLPDAGSEIQDIVFTITITPWTDVDVTPDFS